MRIEKFIVFTIFICICCVGVFLPISGCISSDNNSSINVSTEPPVANGHVYLDSKVVSGAIVEAVSVNGTNHQLTATDDNGFYFLNITPHIWYNITATYQGMRHTVWPVYLPGETNTYDINLTTIPSSTIEGSGYTIGPGGNPDIFKNYDHKRWSGFLMEARSTKDNTTLSMVTDKNGSYSFEVEPDISYEMTGYFTVQKSYPKAVFHYRNYGGLTEGYDNTITVGPNETALVDYEVPMP